MTTSTTPAVRQPFWNGIRSKLRNYIKRQDAPTSTTAETETGEQHSARVKETLDRYLETINLDTTDDRLVNVVNGHIIYTAGLFQARGLADGKIGSRDYHIRHTAVMYARHVKGLIQSRVSGRIRGLNTSLQARAKEEATSSETLDAETNKYEEFLNYSRREHRQFSWALFGLYAVFAAVLLVADLPLSLNLVGYMNIGYSKPSDDFWSKLHDTDLMLFSLGVCFCTVFVKALYDEYINTRLGNTAIGIRQVEERHQLGLPLLRAEYYVKLFLKLLLFTALLVTLYNLGKFRNAFSGVNAGHAYAVDHSITTTTLIAFIGVSVVVPTISGVCLSLCLSILSNILTLKSMKKRVRKLSARLTSVQKEKEGLESLKGELEVFLEDWSTAEKTELTANMLAASYDQAYKSGFLLNGGSNLATMATQFQREQAYQAMSENILKKIP